MQPPPPALPPLPPPDTPPSSPPSPPPPRPTQYLILNDSGFAQTLRDIGVPAFVPETVLILLLLACVVGGFCYCRRRQRPGATRRRVREKYKHEAHQQRVSSWRDSLRNGFGAQRISKFLPKRIGTVVIEQSGEPLPKNWEEHRDEHGETYYWNTRERRPSWSKPVYQVAGRPLPPGWKVYTDDDGRHYFVDDRSNESRERSATWTHPADSMSQGASSGTAGKPRDHYSYGIDVNRANLSVRVPVMASAEVSAEL